LIDTSLEQAAWLVDIHGKTPKGLAVALGCLPFQRLLKCATMALRTNTFFIPRKSIMHAGLNATYRYHATCVLSCGVTSATGRVSLPASMQRSRALRLLATP
jgi:hypothetical protein